MDLTKSWYKHLPRASQQSFHASTSKTWALARSSWKDLLEDLYISPGSPKGSPQDLLIRTRARSYKDLLEDVSMIFTRAIDNFWWPVQDPDLTPAFISYRRNPLARTIQRAGFRDGKSPRSENVHSPFLSGLGSSINRVPIHAVVYHALSSFSKLK